MTWVLHAQFGKETIVLVDEYDAPLACAAEHGYYEDMHRFIGGFLGRAMKTNYPYPELPQKLPLMEC